MELAGRDERPEAILDAKPEHDEVTLEAWWLVVEALRSGHVVRRALVGVPSADGPDAVAVAVLLCDAALDELGVLPAPPLGTARPADGDGAACARLRPTAQLLSRMIISARPTRPVQLANAVSAYRLALVHAGLLLPAPCSGAAAAAPPSPPGGARRHDPEDDR